MISHKLIEDNSLNLDGSSIVRNAVRVVIFSADKLLMLYSLVNGDYKFPGGGVEYNENHIETIERELMEECGATIKQFGRKIGQILEYRAAQEEEKDLFIMKSHYYICEIEDTLDEQSLEEYEKEIKLTPVWVSAIDAYKQNCKIIKKKNPPKWCKRETLFLNSMIESGLTNY